MVGGDSKDLFTCFRVVSAVKVYRNLIGAAVVRYPIPHQPDSIGSRVRQAAEYDKIALMQSNAFKLVREGGTGQHCTAARGIHAELPGFVRPSEEPRDSGRWCALRKPCGREQKSGKGQRTSFHGLSKP